MNAERDFFEALYRDHAQCLRGHARKRVGALDDEDVVHDAFLKLIQCQPEAAWRYPRAYLFAVVQNAGIDALRRRATRLRYVAHEFASANACGYEPAVEPEITRGQMKALLDELPPACRGVFLLYWFEEMSQEQVARHLGVTLRTVERRLARGLAQLRDRASHGGCARA
ncbi:RNA polymerase sigma factor [Methylocystis parvus]|nr:sigma-70 family RNA polymerase sigma factor [Methylocystis parvus]WBK01252.1 sigma-70 family RNA polymerase sigma factor [Methylocystis parvus OBBP]